MDGGLWHCTGGSDQNHSQEKEMQEGRALVWGSLQIAEERREVKSKGESKRYTQPKEEFQRIARKDKKVFLSEQCKEKRKTTEWERLKIYSRKLEIPREYFTQVQFSRSIVSDSLQHHGLQHARLPCPPTTPRACSNPRPSSRWCHSTISSSVVPFSFRLLSQHQGFSNESVLRIRWPNCWSFSFSISPSSEH